MRVLDTAVGGDSVRRVVGGWPAVAVEHAINVGSAFNDRWLIYERGDNKRVSGHQHWLFAPFDDCSLTANADVKSYIEDPRISGIVYRTTWRSLETSSGVYNFDDAGLFTSNIVSALDRCQVLGKKLIVRCMAKVYTGNITDGAGAIPLPANLNVPDYIPADSATYGGTAFRGGIYPVYISATGVGWGAQFETTAVLNRWKALVTAACARFGSHPAFAGWIGPDESTRSCYNGSGYPAGLTFATTSAANRLIYAHDIATWGASKCWPVFNYVEGGTVDEQITEHRWIGQQAANVAFSDIFRMPEQASTLMQPAYWSAIANYLQPGRQILSHVDLLSMGANDSGLTARMIANARQSYRLGSNITAWYPYGVSVGGNAAYWAAIQAAIDATP